MVYGDELMAAIRRVREDLRRFKERAEASTDEEEESLRQELIALLAKQVWTRVNYSAARCPAGPISERWVEPNKGT